MAGWFKRRGGGEQRPEVSSSQVPDGVVVYAVGDIHGRLDLLNDMLARIDADEVIATRKTIVFLGDYIDRGPESKGVIEAISSLQRSDRQTVVALTGNHEEALLAFLGNAAIGPNWAEHGGWATLLSYGISPSTEQIAPDWDVIRTNLAQALPAEHRQFLRSLILWEAIGDYIFVHAGVRPGVPMEKQRRRDLLWIRQEFLEAHTPLDKVIVHGHTPAAEPTIAPGRIGIDTGAYATGVLTALRLEAGKQEFIQTSCGVTP
jgi:serine/threonine protein phosphatase 1